ncbi:C-22 sterol desaturase [Sugiyamaella lignohabitans]|uniref:C-22 sterol desaturase n=1 Tax=Sugiyamaella lignohabitans TaxID=796027 RepID=A0A167DET0_9ASCO|nr:C-22 sterol desaturase [Sugiyamaella lignohabitans]ANB12833.1 C-22 sterol desaturase [Sugiyamaella lignohabitans]
MVSIILKVVGGLVGFLVLLLVREQIVEFQYKSKAKKYGCAPPLTILDRPFGFPSFLKLRKANSEDNIFFWAIDYIESLTDKYREPGVSKDVGLWTTRHQTTFDMNILTVDPENIKSVLATNFKDYSLGIRYQQLLPLLGNGIFTLSGEGWKHSRAMLRPQFSRDQVSQLESLQDHVGTLIDIFKTKSRGGNFFDAQVHFHELTMDTATEFLFGESVDSLHDSQRRVQGPTRLVSASEFASAFQYCLAKLSLRTHCGPLYFLIDSFEFRKRISICHNFVDYFVYKALERPQTTEKDSEGYVFIHELAKETRDPLVIRQQCLNILLAGRDTTASLLSFLTYYLARDKRVWNKLREAVLAEFGETPDSLSFESLKRCTYLNHVINEMLRLHAIVPLNFRTAIVDTVLPRGGGPDQSKPIFVPKGTKVVYSIFVTQRMKALWGEDAAEFRPERWAEGTTHTWDYLPFNGGPRICLGQQFALTEIGFTTVRICQEFKDIIFTGSPSYHKLPQSTGLTISVANGVNVSFVPVDEK